MVLCRRPCDVEKWIAKNKPSRRFRLPEHIPLHIRPIELIKNIVRRKQGLIRSFQGRRLEQMGILPALNQVDHVGRNRPDFF